MTKVNITKSYEVDDEFIGDVLVTAFDGDYGACWYWALAEDCEDMTPAGVDVNEDTKDYIGGPWWTAVRFTKPPSEDDPPESEPTTVVIDKDLVVRGMELVLTGQHTGPQIVGWLRQSVEENDAGMVDADVADCIVQCGLFGEVVYG